MVLILPTALGTLGYVVGQIATVQKFLLSSDLFVEFRQVPIVDQLYLIEVSRRGQESGYRFASIVICLFFSLMVFLATSVAVSILKDGWRKQQGLQAVDVSPSMFFGGIFSGLVCVGIFFLQLPIGDEVRKGRIIENTDLKFVFYYCLAVFCAISIVGIIRFIYQFVRWLLKVLFS